MTATTADADGFWRAVLWIGRLTALLAIAPLLMILVGEPEIGRQGVREWTYLALFPLGFSLGYLLGWRWPVAGGGRLSLVCMVASLVVNRIFGASAYAIWALLSVPGVLLVAAGWTLQQSDRQLS